MRLSATLASMRPLTFAALGLGLCGCVDDFPLPPGAQVSCATSADCPGGRVCDPQLARCVDSIVPPPTAVLAVSEREGTRQTTFVFDASGSTDLSGGALRFAWDADGAGFTADTGDVPSFSAKLSPRAEEFCPALRTPDSGIVCGTSVVVRTVRVRVTNAAGRSAETQLSVVVKNTAPVADFGEDLFVSEDGVPEVELDMCGGVVSGPCTSADPDGDALTLGSFRQVAGPAVTLRALTPGRARFAPPATGWDRPLVFEGDVSDGLSTSTARVRVFRAAHAWVGIGKLDQTFRLHADFRALQRWLVAPDKELRFWSPEGLAVDETGYWFADSEQAAGTYLVHLDRAFVEKERWATTGNHDVVESVPSLVPPRDNAPGCAVLRAVDAGTGDFESLAFVRFDASSRTLDGARHVPVYPQGSGYGPLAVQPAPGGDCWTVSGPVSGQGSVPPANRVGGEIGRLSTNATWTLHANVAGFPAATAVQPDGTLWVAERFPIPLADGGLAQPVQLRYRTVLTRFGPQGAPRSFDYDGGYLLSLAARADGGVWAADARAQALVRVSDEGAFEEVPTTPLVGTSLAYDAVEGALWVVDSLGSRLYRFVEQPDGTLRQDGMVRPDDLPADRNRKGFGNRVVVDPRSGAAVSFVGSAPAEYARWMVVPSHLKRVVRQRWLDLEAGPVRGDPTSGHLWSSGREVVRRIDAAGRVQLEAANEWSSNGAPPFAVDRLGRAWLGSTRGGGALNAVLPDGGVGPVIGLPFEPVFVEVAGDVACAVGRQPGAARVNLSTGTMEPLSTGGDVPYQCAPLATGRVWVLANQYGSASPHRALRFEPGAMAPALVLDVEPAVMAGAGIQVTGSGADPGTGSLHFTTWRFPDYFSYLRGLTADGQDAGVIDLQVPGRLGIGLDVAPRRVCATQAPACLELWVNDRLGRVTVFDGAGHEREVWDFALGEIGRFSLVP